MNIKTDKTDKNVVLAQERRYPAIPLRCDEVIIIDRKGAFEADVLIPFEKIGMPDGISPGRCVELTVLKYRVARAATHAVRKHTCTTSYYTDLRKMKRAIAFSMNILFPYHGGYHQPNSFFTRIFPVCRTCEYRMTQEEYRIHPRFEYISFTRKSIRFSFLKREKSTTSKAIGKTDKTRSPVTVTKEKSRTDGFVPYGFSHPEPVYKGP